LKTSKPWYEIVLHVILPAGLTILLFVSTISLYILPRFKQTVNQDKQALIKELIDSAYDLFEYYHQQVLDGKITQQQAQQQVIEHIRVMRYGPENKDYFWINDLEPKMIMHPYRTDLEGQNVADYADRKGKLLFMEFIETATAPDKAGYVDYMWQWKDDPEKIVPKVSYVRQFEPWGWIIGTGVYVEDVKAEINALTRQLRVHLAVISLIVALISAYLIWHGVKGEFRRQSAEQKVQRSYERFRTVMDSLTSLVYVSDFNTHEVLFLNEHGKSIFGDVIGQSCWQVLQKGQDGPCEFCSNDKLIDGNGDLTGVYTWEFQNTITGHWFECHDQAIRWVDGRLVRLEIATDITTRKEARQQRDQLLKSLALKNEELENIVSIASHDLRSPLINIQGFSGELEQACQSLTELVRSGDLQQDERLGRLIKTDIPESLSFIKANTDKMQMLVNGLLQLSRIGTATLDVKKLDMNELIQSIVTACQYQIKTTQTSVMIDSDLPPVQGDYKQINQVFTNLIDNAIKYCHPDRACEIRISARRQNGRVEYAVSDNGLGIDPAQQHKIFEMFYQLRSENYVGGVGLGLTIVKRIVDIQEGQIHVESEPGNGTTFFISFPSI
jgi:signal transduction histidine kinase